MRVHILKPSMNYDAWSVTMILINFSSGHYHIFFLFKTVLGSLEATLLQKKNKQV